MGGREHVSLAWASKFQMRTLRMTVPIADGVLRTRLCFPRLMCSHSGNYVNTFIHLFKECSLSVYYMPGKVLGAGITAGDEAKQKAKQSKTKR